MAFSTIGGASTGGSAETGGTSGVSSSLSEVVVNDDSGDLNFRVESDGNAHALFVDGGTDRVGIGESSLDAVLHLSKATAGLCNIKLDSVGSAGWRFGIPAGSTSLVFDNANDALTAPKLILDASGNLGVGTSDIKSALTIGTASPVVTVDTADAGDNKSLTLCGGGVGSISRGPYVFLGGNEITANANKGTIKLACGVGDGGSNVGDLYVYQGTSGNNRLLIDQSETVFNEDSIDVDFRVESNGNANMLFVDGGGDTVGIGCTPVEAGANNPSALLMVSNRGTPSTPAEYSPLIVENAAGAAYINVISNDDGYQGVLFGDQTDPDEASIKYNSANKRMYLTGNGEAVASNVLTIDHSANTVGVNVGAPAAGALDVDGVVALKAQGSAPSAAADYGKLYATNDDDGSTVLLCHFEGSDAATSGDGFLDSSATSVHSLTVVGTAQIDTAQYKWGASSLLLDGNSDRINVSDSTDFDWDGAFTVEAWVRFSSLSGWQQVVNSATANTTFFRLAWKGATNEWALAVMNTAFYLSDSLSVDTWYHVALTRDGSNVCRFYRDGVHKGNSTISGTVTNTGGLTIGAYSHLSADQEWLNGWIDEVRIKKGSAIYTGTGSFTPPTGPLIGTTSELYAQDSAGNATKISPHNSDGEWEYFSQNSLTGKTVRINMEQVVSDLGKLTGKNYIKDE